MRKAGGLFKAVSVASALALMQACSEPDAPEAGDEPAPAVEEPVTSLEEPAPIEAPQEKRTASPAPDSASPDGAFTLEWSNDDALCASALSALSALNRAASADADTVEGEDYAARQARRYLATNVNVDWQAQTPPFPGAEASEMATFDYFNDGVDRDVIRLRGDLSGQSVISLGIAEPDGQKIARLSFSYAGATFKDLSDWENLNTKLAYSVSDVVKLPQGYFTLIMPLEDVDGSGRVYLGQWRAKEGAEAPREPTGYYSELACVFRAADVAAKSE